MQLPAELKLGFWDFAEQNPQALAVVEPDGTEVLAGDLLAGCNQLVHALRAQGLSQGDCVAFVLPNSGAVLEIFMAAAQAGWFITPINSHLAVGEMAYILEDCGAKAVFGSARYAERLAPACDQAGLSHEQRFFVGDAIAGFSDYAALKAGQPVSTPGERAAGSPMTYTSGTTGRPKGVRRAVFDAPPEVVSTQQALFLSLFGMLPGSQHVHLNVAPLYHTAVINFASNHLHLGHTVVLMDKWTPEGMLERIERYQVTTTHMVPTMFVRLLKMDEAERLAYDCSSVSHMIHGAAPCPVDVKQRMLAWWGEAVYEYYAASEGGGTLVTPQQWLEKPGTVGPPWPISEIEIRDDDGVPVPVGEPGTVWIAMGEHRFTYHGDEAKTREAWRDRFFTVGDAGYLDEEGWLYLCDRKADMIISGGVNIYPAEIEAVLLRHDQVLDAAVFGVPDEDWGEAVHAVLQLRPDAGEVEAEVRRFCAEQLARYKQPKSYGFVDELPRDPNGKLYKRRLRDPFWAGRDRAI